MAELDIQTPVQANTDELARMAQTLRRARDFALLFAECNYPTLRARLAGELQAQLESEAIDIAPVDLPASPLDLNIVELLAERAAAAAKPGRRLALFVFGLERLLPLSLDVPPILSYLNQKREAFSQLPGPIVFWLPTRALQLIGRRAPDFWSWRVGVYEFAPDEATMHTALQQYVYGERVERLDDPVRWERIYTLERMLSDFPSDGTEGARARADMLHHLAVLYRALDQTAPAANYLEREISLRREMGDTEGLAVAYDDLIALRSVRELERRYLAPGELASLSELERYLPVLVAVPSPLMTAEGDIYFWELDVGSEWQDVVDASRIAYEDIRGVGPPLALVRLNPPTLEALRDALVKSAAFRVFYFTGFSDNQGNLVFEDENGRANLIAPSDLVNILANSGIELVILNSNNTDTIAEALHKQAGIPSIVATNAPMYIAEGMFFGRYFYTRLALSFTVGDAVRSAKDALARAYREGWLQTESQDREAFGHERAEIITLVGDGDLRLSLPAGRDRPDHPLILFGEPRSIGLPDVSSFLGRHRELARLADELVRSAEPVVLQGIGGIGKSWLAAEYARRFSWRYPDGILWLQVTPAFALSDLLYRIGDFLDLELERMADVAEQLQRVQAVLTGRRCLLVFDEAERLTPKVRRDIVDFLRPLTEQDGTRWLITSREHLPEFTEIVARRLAVEPMEEQDASRLLMAEARARGIAEEVARHVRALLYHAEGHPLLLKLIVGLVAQEGIETVLEQMSRPVEGRFEPFERTIEAVLHRSVERLSERGQELLEQLSVFAGGWDRAAFETVLGKEAQSGLQELVERGLIEQVIEGRYRMHQIVVGYVHRQAMLGTLVEAADRHARYYLTVAQTHAADYDALMAELNNIRAGFARTSADATRDDAMVRDYALTMFDFFYARGYWDEALRWSEEATRACEQLNDLKGLALTYYNSGLIRQARGDYESARYLYQQSFEISEQLGDQHGLAAMLHVMANIALAQGDYHRARDLYWRSLEIVERLGDRLGQANTLHQLAIIEADLARYAQAEELYRRSLEIKRELDDHHGEAATWHELANIAVAQGRYSEALEYYQRSREINERLGDWRGTAANLHALANVAAAMGRYDEAVAQYLQSLEIKERLGDQRGMAATLHNLASVEIARGRYEEAQQLYQQSLEIAQQLGDKRFIAATLHQLGMLAQDTGDYAEAYRLYQQALGIVQELGDRAGLVSVLHNLGVLAQSTGDYPEARRLYQQSTELARELGDRAGLATTSYRLGTLAYDMSDYAEARQLFEQALSIFRELGNRHGEAVVLSNLGRLAEACGEPAQTERLYLEALTISERLSSPYAATIKERLAVLKPLHYQILKYDGEDPML